MKDEAKKLESDSDLVVNYYRTLVVPENTACPEESIAYHPAVKTLSEHTLALRAEGDWFDFQLQQAADFETYTKVSLDLIENYRKKIELVANDLSGQEILPFVRGVQPNRVNEVQPRSQSLSDVKILIEQFKQQVGLLATDKSKKLIKASSEFLADMNIAMNVYTRAPDSDDDEALYNFKKEALLAVNRAKKILGKHDLGKVLVDLAAAVIFLGFNLLVNKYKNNTFFRQTDNQRFVSNLQTKIEKMDPVNSALLPRAE